ncbi:hypothetical protein M9H77_21456 [Catharanthus roseus]|uniref:Uncharacterized protein n=1 Tax=Catharanthus roseus TaxID=4058 RepID=A0ACC0AQB2_CATRO|nr:hypothetical protein M9H77_21456 [Catharanthus roseus]
MTPNKHWFSDFKPLNHGKVYMRNNHVCDVKGIGNIFIKMHDGVTRKLTEVRYVPNLHQNLFSLGYLDSLGLSYKSKTGILRVCKGNLVMIKGFKKERIYILIGKIVCDSTALISKTIPEKTMLWHWRIGHIILYTFTVASYVEEKEPLPIMPFFVCHRRLDAVHDLSPLLGTISDLNLSYGSKYLDES